MIKIIYKKPQEKAVVMEIENTLETLQELIGGYLEMASANDKGDIVMLFDEEGRMKNLENNVWIRDTCVVGNVIFALRGEDDITSLTNEMCNALLRILNSEV